MRNTCFVPLVLVDQIDHVNMMLEAEKLNFKK
jgi:hypothetical protein